MSPGFDKTFLEQLKSKTDIVQIISSYIPLQRKGKSHWACCPFHHEKTPSFCIDGEGQFYHCFGCGAGGDVIKFVQEYESLDFAGAVRLLAEKAKMELPESSYDAERVAKERKEKERLLAMMKQTALYYVSALRGESGEAHRAYLEGRGVDEKTVKRFGLGASPDFDTLPKFLAQKGFTREEMLKVGVVGEKNGRLYDALGGRLIFPVISQMGEVVAFGGRLMEKKPSFAKYKNTQETELFQKRKTLYNLNLVKKYKNEHGLPYVIMVEGYMDTISLTAEGFANVVASMGTSLTSDQARLIKRYTDTVVISYDGDSAGQNASMRGLEILEGEGLKVKVAVLPDGLDPDEVIRQRGKEAYQKCLNDALPLIDYKLYALKQKHNLKTTDGKREYIAEALKIVQTCEDNFLKEELLKRLRSETGITYESLQRDAAAVGEEQPQKQPDIPEPAHESAGDAALAAARFVLHALLSGKSYAKEVDPTRVIFPKSVHGVIADYVVEKREEGETPNPSMLYEYVEESEHDEVGKILAESLREIDPTTEQRYFKDCLITLKRIQLQAEIEALTAAFKAETDTEQRKDLAILLQKKTLQLKKLS